MKKGRTLRGGFTIIELLVVITIIAILAILAGSVAQQIQVQARQTECASNMRKLANGVLLFAGDNEGRFPLSMHTEDREDAWVETLRPFISNVDEIRISPSDKRRREAFEEGNENVTSYVFSNYLVVPPMDDFGAIDPNLPYFPSVTAVTRPAETAMLFVSSDVAGLSNDHTHVDIFVSGSWTGFLDEVQADRHLAGRPDEDRTKGSAAYAYVDGHIEVIRAEEMKERIESGENVALPPDE